MVLLTGSRMSVPSSHRSTCGALGTSPLRPHWFGEPKQHVITAPSRSFEHLPRISVINANFPKQEISLVLDAALWARYAYSSKIAFISFSLFIFSGFCCIRLEK